MVTASVFFGNSYLILLNVEILSSCPRVCGDFGEWGRARVMEIERDNYVGTPPFKMYDFTCFFGLVSSCFLVSSHLFHICPFRKKNVEQELVLNTVSLQLARNCANLKPPTLDHHLGLKQL